MTEPTEIMLTDRYAATGRPYPEPSTVCLGQCEGMGCVPHKDNPEEGGIFQQLWEEEHAEAHKITTRIRNAWRFEFLPLGSRFAILWERCDGWHFVKCPDCGGTGKRPPGGFDADR